MRMLTNDNDIMIIWQAASLTVVPDLVGLYRGKNARNSMIGKIGQLSVIPRLRVTIPPPWGTSTHARNVKGDMSTDVFKDFVSRPTPRTSTDYVNMRQKTSRPLTISNNYCCFNCDTLFLNVQWSITNWSKRPNTVFKLQTALCNVPFTNRAVKPCIRNIWYPAGVCCIYPRRG